MEHYKLFKLLNDSIAPKFSTRKWIKVNYLSGGQYSDNNLCDYSDTYIVVKGTVDLGVGRNNDMTQKRVVFKDNAPFRSKNNAPFRS